MGIKRGTQWPIFAVASILFRRYRPPMANLVEALAARLDRRAAERMHAAEQRAADLAQRATLIAIERNGRMLTWVFERAGRTYRVETIGSMSDNVPGWRVDLFAPLEDET